MLALSWLMALVFVVLWPMGAGASAIVVPKAPEPLERMERAFASLVDGDEPELWTHAEEDARVAAEAWQELRDGEEGARYAPNVVWRLDSICDYLPQAVERRSANRVRMAALVGLHLFVPLRAHYRSEGDLALRRLRAELREVAVHARAGKLVEAERARGRADYLWKRLRGRVERRARGNQNRFAQLGSYFDVCFRELAIASNQRDRERLHRAARSALDLTEVARTMLERPRSRR